MQTQAILSRLLQCCLPFMHAARYCQRRNDVAGGIAGGLIFRQHQRHRRLQGGEAHDELIHMVNLFFMSERMHMLPPLIFACHHSQTPWAST